MPAPAMPPDLGLPRDVLSRWQGAVDLMAELIKVPAGLVTRIRDRELEVLVSSEGKRNPFTAGERRELLGSGLFCEEAVRTRGRILVKDGRKMHGWRDAPVVNAGWVAHLGYPLFQPGGHLFGTICVMDTRARAFSVSQQALVSQTRDLVEIQISLLIANRKRKERVRLMDTYREELRQLRATFPLCPSCKKIRNDPDYWEAVEEYFVTHAMGEFGHGLCPSCSAEHWGETVLEPEPVPLPRGLGIPGTARA